MPEPEHIERRRAALIAYDVCRRALTPTDPARRAAMRPVLDAWVRMIAAARAAGRRDLHDSVSRADGADVVSCRPICRRRPACRPHQRCVAGGRLPDEIAPRPEDYALGAGAFYGRVASAAHAAPRHHHRRRRHQRARTASARSTSTRLVAVRMLRGSVCRHSQPDKQMKMYARIRTLDQVAAMLRRSGHDTIRSAGAVAQSRSGTLAAGRYIR
jgi:hypothetical protein